MRRVEVRTWALAFAVLLADAAILTMFAVTNTVIGQPQGVDRLIFGTFGLLLAALAPAALARIIGVPELQTAVQSMTRGSRVVAAGAGIMAAKGALLAAATGRSAAGAAAAGGGGGAAGTASSALHGPGPGPAGGGSGTGGTPSGPGGGSSGGAPSGAAASGTGLGGATSTGTVATSGSSSSGVVSPSTAAVSTAKVASSEGMPSSASADRSAVATHGGGAVGQPGHAAPDRATSGTATDVLGAPSPVSGGWGSALTRRPAGVGRG
jgi:type IV secretion system protein TrbL